MQTLRREEAARLLILSVCNQIVSGQIPPGKGAARIVYNLRLTTSESQAFLRLEGLLSEWEDLPDKRSYFEEQIILAARVFPPKPAVGLPPSTLSFRVSTCHLHAVSPP